MIFFTSDQHFGHFNIINYCDRPFKSVEEMNKTIIKNWNKKVKPNDTVYVLGDYWFTDNKNKSGQDFINQLHGRKILIRGNHDPKDTQCYKDGFEFVCREVIIKELGREIRLSHYPYKWSFWKRLKTLTIFKKKPRNIEKRPINDGRLLIHGHTHSKNKINEDGSIHIGVDAWDFYPVSLDQIQQLIDKHNL